MKKYYKKIISKFRKAIPETNPIRVYWHFLKAIIANIIYFFPSKKFKIIGVTGTDGKTTTVEILSAIFREANIPFAKISTNEIEINKKKYPNETHRTTLSPFQMAKFFKKCKKAKIKYVVLEASSHALFQKRLFGVKFDYVILTNITPEHLDFHKTLKNLQGAKKLLFTKYLKKDGYKVVNFDDPVYEIWSKELKIDCSYSIKNSNATFYASQINDTSAGINFLLNKKTKITTNLHGNFNVSNILGAVAVAKKLNIKYTIIQKALEDFQTPKGRMDEVKINDADFRFFVDFGLTPNAFKNTFQTFADLARQNNARFFAIFGATGDRDKTKRPLLGEIAGNLADGVFLTDDETYTENAHTIREEVKKGLFLTDKNFINLKIDSFTEKEKIKLFSKALKEKNNFFVEIPQREDAILASISAAKKNDIIVAFSIGAFLSRNVYGKEIYWNEKEEAQKSFKKVKKWLTK